MLLPVSLISIYPPLPKGLLGLENSCVGGASFTIFEGAQHMWNRTELNCREGLIVILSWGLCFQVLSLGDIFRGV